jgi:hypothetical protein
MGEEEIELAATQKEMVEIEMQIRASTEKHNAFLRELGLSRPPGGIAERTGPRLSSISVPSGRDGTAV